MNNRNHLACVCSPTLVAEGLFYVLSVPESVNKEGGRKEGGREREKPVHLGNRNVSSESVSCQWT